METKYTEKDEETILKWMKEEKMSRDQAEELLALSKFGSFSSQDYKEMKNMKIKKKKNNNLGFFTNDLISDSSEKGKRKLDGSGRGTRENKGRGGCSPEEQKKKDHKRMFSDSPSTIQTKKDNPLFYDYSRKTEDFTSDGNSFKTDKSQTKWNLVGTLAQAYNIWQNAIKAGDQETIERAAKVYWDLKSYITEDFTDDGRWMNIALLAELVKSWEAIGQSEDPAANRRVERMFHELLEYMKKELKKAGKKSDFMDDTNLPVTNKLYSLMTQILYILDRQMNRIERELMKMTDRERDRLYDHPFIKEFRIDMLP
jgi:hypothetical protein